MKYSTAFSLFGVVCVINSVIADPFPFCQNTIINRKRKNPPNEDRLIAVESSLQNNMKLKIHGVFDGHGGFQTSNWLSENYQSVLVQALEKLNIPTGQELSSETVESVKETIKNTAFDIDRKLCNEIKDEIGGSGSTASFVVRLADHSFVVNIGDSRTMVARKSEGTENTDIIFSSKDHKPTDEEERAHVEAAGGEVTFWNGPRINFYLAVSRSFGDCGLKHRKENSENTDSETLAYDGEGILRVTPDIEVIKLEKGLKYSYFSATDGFFDADNQQFFNTGATLALKRPELGEKICQWATKKAQQDFGSSDDVTVVVATHEL